MKKLIDKSQIIKNNIDILKKQIDEFNKEYTKYNKNKSSADKYINDLKIGKDFLDEIIEINAIINLYEDYEKDTKLFKGKAKLLKFKKK